MIKFAANLIGMNDFFEVLKYTLPSTVVFLTVYFLLKQYFEQERIKLYSLQNKERYQTSLPLKLQAYERITLFLERLKITNLVLRFPISGSKPAEYCELLSMGIQQEFEHNLVQQLYVSEKLWEIVVWTKEEILNEIDRTGHDLATTDLNTSKDVLIAHLHQKTTPILDKALSAVKKEIQLLV